VPEQSESSVESYVVGVDFGTLSGRALVVRVSDGAEMGSAVAPYLHGVMERTLTATGERLPAEWALQVPSDYIDVLRTVVPEALAASGVNPADVIGIGTDFTACTVLPTTSDGTPLCELPEFTGRPHAYVKLWKHHSAQPHADRINATAHERGESWIARYGGKQSSEWELAKGLQLLEEDPEVYERMDHWVEAADWIVWQLCGRYVRNVTTDGFKAVRQDGAYPSAEFLTALNPELAYFFTTKVAWETAQLGERVGGLTQEAAAWTGLPVGIAVATGNVDAHVTSPAARAIEPGQMLAVMGTSTCHVMNGESLAEVPGMCGVVADGITPGSWAYEAGQSGVGDIFAWFVDTAVPGRIYAEADARGLGIHEYLSELASELRPGEHGLAVLDWISGNRSVLVNHELSGMVLGITMATQPHEIYRALLEATAYGTRVIVEAFDVAGVPVRELVCAGGLVRNGVLMQLYADIVGLPLSVLDSEQGPALGSAIHAAVAAGAYPDVRIASERMGRIRRAAYVPDPTHRVIYDRLYREYVTLHDYFGRGVNDVMLNLKALRREVLAR
jgi:L-ribulokinase